MLTLNLNRVMSARKGKRFIEDFLIRDDIYAEVNARPTESRWARQELSAISMTNDFIMVKTRKGFAAVDKAGLAWATQRKDEEARMRAAHMR